MRAFILRTAAARRRRDSCQPFSRTPTPPGARLPAPTPSRPARPAEHAHRGSNDTVAESSHRSNLPTPEAPNRLAMLTPWPLSDGSLPVGAPPRRGACWQARPRRRQRASPRRSWRNCARPRPRRRGTGVPGRSATTRPPPSSTSTTPSCRAPRSSTSAAACTSGSSSRRANSPGSPGSRRGSGWPASRTPSTCRTRATSALSIVKGHRVAELMAIGEEIYDEYMAERIWPGTRALAQAHLDAGQKVWLVTAAPVETATIIARRLGLTGALGTVAESVDGVYTGKLVGEPLHGPAKAEAVRALAAAEGLDLARCAAYSDSAQRHPDALAGRPPVRDQPRQPSSASTPANWTGGCATTAPAARRPRSASRRRPASARWRAARQPRSPCTAAAADAHRSTAVDGHARVAGARARTAARGNPSTSYPHRRSRPVTLPAPGHNTPRAEPTM